MSLNDELLDRQIKEQITWELEQIPVPTIEDEWLKFKDLALNLINQKNMSVREE